MSQYAFSHQLNCIVSIDFALSPLGKSKLGYDNNPKESQNFDCPFPSCSAQMAMRGWRVIKNEQRLPKNRSFARMGKQKHIPGCTVESATYELPDEESNGYTAINPAIVKTNYILQGNPSKKRQKENSTVKRNNVSRADTKNHNIHGLLAIVQKIMDPLTNKNEPANITWRKPKNTGINGLQSARTFNDLVVNLFQRQELNLKTNTINIFFGYAKFDLNRNVVRAKVPTSIQSAGVQSKDANPYIMVNICLIEELREQALENENAAELLTFIDNNSEQYRVFAIAGYLTKSVHQQSSLNKVFYNLTLYSDSLSDSFVFLGGSQYNLAKPYFETNRNSV